MEGVGDDVVLSDLSDQGVADEDAWLTKMWSISSLCPTVSFCHADGGRAYVFRVPPDKVIAFAKSPHGSSTFRR